MIHRELSLDVKKPSQSEVRQPKQATEGTLNGRKVTVNVYEKVGLTVLAAAVAGLATGLGLHFGAHMDGASSFGLGAAVAGVTLTGGFLWMIPKERKDS